MSASPQISGLHRLNARRVKPVSQITDRAKRYRANAEENRPANPKMCGYCGSRRNVGVDHIDGNESHGDTQNLMWACKSCNGTKTNIMRRARIGVLTEQYNPGRSSRTEQMRAYGNAIKVMRGEFDGDVSAALATIKGTPASVRSAYTSRTWATRKAIYGPSGRGNPGMKKNSSNALFDAAYDLGTLTPAGAVLSTASRAFQKRKNRSRRTSKSNRGRIVRAASSRGNRGKIERYILNAGTRRNPEGSAVERYEYFHGRGPEVDTVFKTEIHQHEVLSGIGKLVELEILAVNGNRKVIVSGFKGAILAQDEKGKQLYIVGGDQSVNLKDFGITQAHELEILGALTAVVYFTTKDHLMPQDGGTANYKHKFGDGKRKYEFGRKGTRFPLVGYDVRNKLLSIQGGGYDLPAEGIDG